MEASRALLAPAMSETAERLFREHSGWIYGYCLRLLRSPEDAEDALQATYLNACRSLNQGVRPHVDSAWLLRITQNACLTRLRSSSRRARFEHAGDFALLEETVPAPDRPADDLIGLADALAQLPEQQRRAILLREWQGLSHSEVAQQLGLTRAAAETLIFRARRSLAAALENPAKRARLRSLHALDLGGLLAAIKGFLAGAAGVKAVAAVGSRGHDDGDRRGRRSGGRLARPARTRAIASGRASVATGSGVAHRSERPGLGFGRRSGARRSPDGRAGHASR